MQRFWKTIIEPIAEILQPKFIVEIGSDHGGNTRNLLEFCRYTDARLDVIDPLPKYNFSDWEKRYGDDLVFHQALSLDALGSLTGMDLVLIDGDHNWYTVFNELELIEKRSRELDTPFPVVMLHDIGWPYGRRDLYYDPDTIPDTYRKPYDKKGMRPRHEKLLDEGGLNQHLHNAVYENDLQNGVLTAVEDFLKHSTENLDLVKVSGFHGFGILVPEKLNERNSTLREYLKGLDVPKTAARISDEVEQARQIEKIDRVEFENRTSQRIRRLRDELATKHEELIRLQEDSERKSKELVKLQEDSERKSKELEALREESAELSLLRGWMDELQVNVPAHLNSRQWRMGYALGEIRRRLLRRPRVPTAAVKMKNVIDQYRTWKGSGTDVFTANSIALERGLAGRSVRFVLRALDSRNPKAVAKNIFGRVVSSGDRKVRRGIQHLRPRMPHEELAGEIRARLGPTPRAEEWPPISVVVLNRDGLAHLEKLFAGLAEHTDYPNFEVVLVDNASSDESVEFVRSFDGPFPVRIVENTENVSFSDGNNQGAQAASDDLLLFLNNDIEPFEPGWLKEMVVCARDSKASAVGARLLYTDVTENSTASGYAVQHRGIKFRKLSGEFRARNLFGDDALSEYLGLDEECPAVTAACLLIERRTFDSVGGFTSGYRYGTEDVDLCLKLISQDEKIVSSGRAVLFHDESSSQNRAGNTFKRINRTGNWQLFNELWGPRIRRRLNLELLGDGTVWTGEAPHVAITLTSNDRNEGYGDWYTGHELGDALERIGWRVSYVQGKRGDWYRLPEDLDYLIVLLDKYDLSHVPPGVTTIAWVRNWTERWLEHEWFERYDVVLASSGISREIVERRSVKSAEVFPIASNPNRFTEQPTELSYASDYTFTGSYWGHLRGVIGEFEVAPDETFMVFGKGWESIPHVARHARGFVDYDQLPAVYSSTKLIVDDAAFHTLPYGAVNSRVFDALATGTLVVTNCESGVRELFDEDFPTYGTRIELRERLDELLSDDVRREELARRYQDVVLKDHTYDRRAEQLEEILRRRSEALSFCIKIGAPNRRVAESWGDLHFAKAIKRQLERRGHPCLIQTLDEWDDLEGLKYDVALHLKGLTAYATKPGQLNVMWNISHPNLLTGRECDRYDLVFTASRRWAERLNDETKTPVRVLEQATDPEVFYPDHDEELANEMVFVGNSRRVERRIMRDLLPTDRDLAVWGADWEGLIDRCYIRGTYLPNDRVRRAYSSSDIVLNDHWDDMREHGFVSNRIYDALASGAFVISDDLPEIRETLEDSVVTYRSRQELADLVEYYLAHPEERVERSRRGREIVLSRYTFDHRVETILDAVRERLSAGDVPTRIGKALPGNV